MKINTEIEDRFNREYCREKRHIAAVRKHKDRIERRKNSRAEAVLARKEQKRKERVARTRTTAEEVTALLEEVLRVSPKTRKGIYSCLRSANATIFTTRTAIKGVPLYINSAGTAAILVHSLRPFAFLLKPRFKAGDFIVGTYKLEHIHFASIGDAWVPEEDPPPEVCQVLRRFLEPYRLVETIAIKAARIKNGE